MIISITILILIAKIQFLNRSFFFKTSFCDLFFTKFGIKKLRKKKMNILNWKSSNMTAKDILFDYQDFTFSVLLNLKISRDIYNLSWEQSNQVLIHRPPKGSNWLHKGSPERQLQFKLVLEWGEFFKNLALLIPKDYFSGCLLKWGSWSRPSNLKWELKYLFLRKLGETS